MQNKKILRFLQSFLYLPLLFNFSGILDLPKENQPQVEISGEKQEIVVTIINKDLALNTENNSIKGQDSQKKDPSTDSKISTNTKGNIDPKYLDDLETIAQAKKIDAYFKLKKMPLKGYGMKMVVEAKKNDLDWRVIAAVAVRESTGGKFACKRVQNNPFGWGSCKIGFKSIDEAIETVARNLGGNNKKTAIHYKGKELEDALNTYNGYVVESYARDVASIMEDINEA